MPQEPKRYVESPARKMGGFLPEDVFVQAMAGFILVCTDFTAIDRTRRTLFLAKRVIQASRGVWRFGGRQKAGETMRESCVRLAKRELDLVVDPARFEYVTMTEDLWAWRQQEPQDTGVHDVIHVFTVEFSSAELQHAKTYLDPKEYDLSFGIQEYGRERLVAEGVRPQLIDLYDLIFPDNF